MADYPQALADVVDDFGSISDRSERVDMLIETADRFDDSAKVPPSIATQPYDESHRVLSCESEAFVWSQPQADGTLKFYFDVLNPQGLSAKAMSVILDETLSGKPLDQVAKITTEVVYPIFGREVSMGKSAGLMGIVQRVQYEAKKHLAEQKSAQ